MKRIFIISDLHVDHSENQQWVNTISASDYQQDVLLLAGDICHNFELLKATLVRLRGKFNSLYFTPGNHDLWLHGEDWPDSFVKLQELLRFCRQNDIGVEPRRAGEVWIVPLLSWYTLPGEGDDNLYHEKPGEDPTNRMWSDNYFVRWPNSGSDFRPGARLAAMNELHLKNDFAGMVITMSHFIPRKEMMFGQYPPVIDMEKIKKYDRSPQFNFSRVAGSSLIDEQLRRAGSILHVYGHQHINRDRVVDGVRYVAHCLGYPAERRRGMIRGIEQGLKQVWPQPAD